MRSKAVPVKTEVRRPEPPLEGFIALLDDERRPLTDFEPVRYRMKVRRSGFADQGSSEVVVDPFATPIEWRGVPAGVAMYGLFDKGGELVFWQRLTSRADEGWTVVLGSR